MPLDRKDVLLRAAYDLLTRSEYSTFVTEAACIQVRYDEANCDGYCLREDIADALGITKDMDPIPLEAEDESD